MRSIALSVAVGDVTDRERVAAAHRVVGDLDCAVRS
jgi:hypothetical protein